VVGTPAYMAPEVVKGEAASVAADIYGLGAVLYTLLAGKPPFEGHSAHTVLWKVVSERARATGAPATVERVVERLMHKEPQRRPHTARVAVELLLACAAELEAAREDRARPPRGRRWTVGVGLAAIGLLGAAALWRGRGDGSASPAAPPVAGPAEGAMGAAGTLEPTPRREPTAPSQRPAPQPVAAPRPWADPARVDRWGPEATVSVGANVLGDTGAPAPASGARGPKRVAPPRAPKPATEENAKPSALVGDPVPKAGAGAVSTPAPAAAQEPAASPGPAPGPAPERFILPP
jgi:serine/threonine-protein kinase